MITRLIDLLAEAPLPDDAGSILFGAVLGFVLGLAGSLITGLVKTWWDDSKERSNAELAALRSLSTDNIGTYMGLRARVRARSAERLKKLIETGDPPVGDSFMVDVETDEQIKQWFVSACGHLYSLKRSRRKFFQPEAKKLMTLLLGDEYPNPLVDNESGKLLKGSRATLQRVLNFMGIAEATLEYLQDPFYLRAFKARPWRQFEKLLQRGKTSAEEEIANGGDG